MIQRIQSIFLLIAVVVSGVLSNVFDLWKSGVEWMQANDYYGIFALFLASAVLSLVVIFLYKDRKRQLIFNRINLMLNLVLVGLLVFRLFNLPGDGVSSEKGVGLFLPLVSMVMLVLANRSIKKDEKLVKSIDRIR